MNFDPYQQWLDIPSDRRPPSHYDLLGLPETETDVRAIHAAAAERYEHVRNYMLGPQGEHAHRILNEISQALNCLADPKRREEYRERLATDGLELAWSEPPPEDQPGPLHPLAPLPELADLLQQAMELPADASLPEKKLRTKPPERKYRLAAVVGAAVAGGGVLLLVIVMAVVSLLGAIGGEETVGTADPQDAGREARDKAPPPHAPEAEEPTADDGASAAGNSVAAEPLGAASVDGASLTDAAASGQEEGDGEEGGDEMAAAAEPKVVSPPEADGTPPFGPHFVPSSPEAKETLAKAIAYLETHQGQDTRFGAAALVGMALVKAGHDAGHPAVAAAVEQIRGHMDRLPTSREENLVYGLSFSIAFLASLDHEAYRAEIEQLLPYLQSMQKPHGGWGYLTQMTGDTSMTQHALLAVWELERAGFDIRPAMIENAAGWLLKTQDPSGAFGYQGTEAPGSSCVPQTQVGLSMGAAGASSLYLCCDLLGLSAEQEPEEQDALPRALKRVAKEPTQPIEQYRALSGVQVKWAQGRSNGWMQSNYRPEIRLVARPVAATNYYLYALERYWSFREAADGEPAGNADWYGDGVRFLASSQRYDGSWIDYCGPLPDTAFAVLFLVRSMKQGIERGRLVAEPAVEVVEPLEDAIELPSDVLALNQSGQQVELEVLPLVFPDRLVPQQTEPTDVLTVRLLAKPSEDYKVKWSAIDRIELFEDRFAEGAGGPDNERPRGLAPWAIQFMRGSTLESYALQLDFFGIELGVVDSWSELGYASGFAQSKPDLHSGPIAQENRRYFLSARGDKFREMDWELLRRAGVTAENPLVLKFLPPDWAEKMAAFEAAQPDGGRLTVFDVQREFFDESGAIPEGKGYSLRVSVSGDR